MQNPRNLRVYPAAKNLAVAIYALTLSFPRDERFGLTSQMRRAAVSIGSNIAEGCGRRGNKALLAFVFIAIGSLNELDFQLDLSVELGFVANEEAFASSESIKSLRRMLTSLATQLKSRRDTPDELTSS
jgi:four helix bundle protein